MIAYESPSKKAVETTNAVVALLAEMKDGRERFELRHVIAGILDSFSHEHDLVWTLDVQWGLETFVYRRVLTVLPIFQKIYDYLAKEKIYQENSLDYNDMDNHMWIVPDDDKQVIAITSQNFNFLFIKCDRYFHIRQFWNDYKDQFDLDCEYDKEDLQEFKDRGIEKAVESAEWAIENWSDCIEGVSYVNRPNYKWFVDKKFVNPYNDCRDSGYVATIDIGGYVSMRCDIKDIYRINNAVFEIRSTECEIDSLVKQ